METTQNIYSLTEYRNSMSDTVNSALERGIAFKVEGRYEDALTELQQVLAHDPNSPDGHYQVGLVYGFTGLFDESIESLKVAVDLVPDRLDIRNDLALTYCMLGMYEEAKMEFEEVLRQDPGNKRAIENMQYL